MVEKYENHHHHLELLKKVIENHPDAKKAKALKETYTAYVGKTDDKTQNQDDFYKAVEKNLDDSPDAKEIKRLIQLDQFMPKQRTGQNGAILINCINRSSTKLLKSNLNTIHFWRSRIQTLSAVKMLLTN